LARRQYCLKASRPDVVGAMFGRLDLALW